MTARRTMVWMALVSAACGGSAHDPSDDAGDGAVDSDASGDGSDDALVQPWECPTWGERTVVGAMQNLDITEASGIEVSERNEGVLWVHNDSGDTERVFAMTLEGDDLGQYVVSDSLQNDWEDLSVGPGPEDGVSYLYLASIGGNLGRNDVYVYRVPEPAVTVDQAPMSRALTGAVRLDMEYPNDEQHDAESLAVDPRNGDIYIVTKNGAAGRSTVFRSPAPQGEEKVVLEPVATLMFETNGNDGAGAATGADMTADDFAIRTYAVLHLWHRASGETWDEALAHDRCVVTESLSDFEPQGEAVCFAPNRLDLLTTTEWAWDPPKKEDISSIARN